MFKVFNRIILFSFLILVGCCIYAMEQESESIWQKLPTDSPLRLACMREDACKECHLLGRLIQRKIPTIEETRQALKEASVKPREDEEGGLWPKTSSPFHRQEFVSMIRIVDICDHFKTIEEAYAYLKSGSAISISKVGQLLEETKGDSNIVNNYKKTEKAKKATSAQNVAMAFMKLKTQLDEFMNAIREQENKRHVLSQGNENGLQSFDQDELAKKWEDDHTKLWMAFFEKKQDIWNNIEKH